MKVFSGGANHGRAADVDVLDKFVEGYACFGRGFLEGVKIHYHHIDRRDAVFGHGAAMFRIFAAVKDSAMHLGMEGLDAPVEHFGEAGEFGNIFDGDAGVAQQLGGAAGGDELNSEPGEFAREVRQAGLVGDAEECALDFG